MKTKLLLCLLMAFSKLTSGEVGGFTETVNNSAKIWNKYPSSKRKVEWRGSVDSSGFATGRGVALFKHGGDLAAAYFGTMSSGRMNGHVVAVYPLTGLCYVGQIQDWSEHGYGMMRFPDGSRYEGQWNDGSRQGKGTQWAPGGNVAYQGQFSEDQPVGAGPRFTRPEQSLQSGALVQKNFQSVKIRWYGAMDSNGTASGFGVAVSSGERGISGIYHGLAFRGKLDTNVVAIYANPEARQAYVGEIAAWNENGFGQMFYPDGSVYIGYWKDELRHGEGRMLSSSGELYAKGMYAFGRLVSETKSAISSSADESGRMAAQGNDSPRFDEAKPATPASLSARQEQAVVNIVAMIVGQWGIDYMVDAENSFEGAFLSLISRYTLRPAVIDQNLRVILPDAPDVGIRFLRNLICSVADGTASEMDLLQRTAKTESVVLARRIGTNEADTLRILLFLNDFSARVEKINDRRRDKSN